METNKEDVYLGLGSNVGDRKQNIETALSLLSSYTDLHIDKKSELIETEPWGFESDKAFLNCAVRISVSGNMSPLRLLDICKTIERKMGREESIEYDSSGNRVYHSRIIDIDILIYGNRHISDSKLTVPHPLMALRDFVMVPLRQIVSDRAVEAYPDIFAKGN